MNDRIERREIEEQAAEFGEELFDEALDRPPTVAHSSNGGCGCIPLFGPRRAPTSAAPTKKP